MMHIYPKSCPHCKTGDCYIEDHIDETFGKMYFMKCNQCGWEKDVTVKIKKFKREQNVQTY